MEQFVELIGLQEERHQRLACLRVFRIGHRQEQPHNLQFGRKPMTQAPLILRVDKKAKALLLRAALEALQRELTGKPTREVFETIYRKKMWGGHVFGGRFYSGSGSRDKRLIEPYIAAVGAYLVGWGAKPVVVDIGCGDFHVGRKMIALARRYVGCDIVPSLIEHLRDRFRDPRLEFRLVDAIEDHLPTGDIAIIRQVLQHLSNAQVALILPKLIQYKSVIVTEHVPYGQFVPNVDKPTGLDNRLCNRSGLILTAAPFHFSPKGERTLCEVPQHGAVIRTIAYEF
jgi:SAM-dependent methyltransferase